MRTPLSIYNLLDGGWRTILSMVGIGIAIVLMFMQLGFLGAVRDTAVLVYDELEFDLVIRSSDYYFLVDGHRFPRERLFQIRGLEFVNSVQPFHVTLGQWSYPDAPPASGSQVKGVQRGILILGASPGGEAFSDEAIADKASLLGLKHLAIVDVKSSTAFLGVDSKQGFDQSHANQRLPFELNDQACELIGVFELGAGLAADGAVILNEAGFARVMPGYSENDVTLGLVKLSPAVAPDLAAQQIQKHFDQLQIRDVEVLTRASILQQETNHWIAGTPVGFIFMAGVGVALIVGAIIVYIVLSSDVSRQLGEYATLKAMGYRNSYLSSVVLSQAVLLGLFGYVGATAISFVLYWVVTYLTNLPIQMDLWRLVFVLVATLLMCCLSGVIAIQKLRRADPADLF